MPGYADPQNLNRYSYVLNNPLRYIDPSGHNPCRSDYLCKRRAEKLRAKEATVRQAVPGQLAQHAAAQQAAAQQAAADQRVEARQAAAQQAAAQQVTAPIPNPNPVTKNFVPPVGDPKTDPKEYNKQLPAEDKFSPMVSIGGILLFVQMGILDGVLGYGIAMAAASGPIGWAGELILLPLEITSIGLTIYASQVAATGTTDHDPIPIWHAIFPNFLPYKPKE